MLRYEKILPLNKTENRPKQLAIGAMVSLYGDLSVISGKARWCILISVGTFVPSCQFIVEEMVYWF